MTTSPGNSPTPVPLRRYRYSKWRWRILVRLLDLVGAFLMGIWRCFRQAPTVTTPKSILLVQIDHLGDAVLTSPILAELKAAFPEATTTVLASPSNRAVFEASPHVDQVIVAQRNWFERQPGRWALWSAVWKLGLSLRRLKFDMGIDIRGDVLTVFVLALAGIPRRIGWTMGGGGFLLTDVARWVPERHEVLSRQALLECLGIPVEPQVRVEVFASDDDRLRVSELVARQWSSRSGQSRTRTPRELVLDRRSTHAARGAFWGIEDSAELSVMVATEEFGQAPPLLAVHLGAGTPAKRWPLTHWQSLTRKFLEDGWRVVVVGGSEDAEISRLLDPHPDVLDLSGRLSVSETTALLEQADLFIGADSGPAHLAACAGIPSIILFSGTNRHRQWRPWSSRTLVLRSPVSCRPCHQKECPLAGHPCMNETSPERVYRAAYRWWRRAT